MVHVHYKVTCDWCGAFRVSCQTCPSEAIRLYLLGGGLCHNEFHFCNDHCLNLYLQSLGKIPASTEADVTGDDQEERG